MNRAIMESINSPTTPTKSVSSDDCFSPIFLPQSPAEFVGQRNITGIPRTVRDLIADLYNTIQRWNDKHLTGAAILKQITFTSAKPSLISLEKYVKELYSIVQQLQSNIDTFEMLHKQMFGIVKMGEDIVPFHTLNLKHIADTVSKIVAAYQSEFKVKEFVLENVAFAHSDKEALCFAASWIHQINITTGVTQSLATLLLESNHWKVH